MATRITRRNILKWGMVGIGGVALAACTPTAPTAAPTQAPAAKATAVPPTPAPPAKIELNVYQQDPYGLATWEAMYSEYESKHPNVTIPRLLIPFADIEAKVLTALAAAEPLDTLYVHMQQGHTYALKGAIIPLDDYWPSIGVPDADWTPSLHAFDWRGHKWVLPFHNNFFSIGYNPKLLQEAGLEDPRELHKQNQWTLDKFDEYVRKLTKGEGAAKVFGAQWMWGGSMRIMVAMYLWGHNADTFTQDEAKMIFNSPEALQAWERMAQYRWNELTPSPSDTEGIKGAALWSKYAFGSISRTTIKQYMTGGQTPPVQMCPLFSFPNGNRDTRVGVAGMGIFSKSKYKQEAWEFVKWLGTEGHEKLVADAWCDPLWMSTINSSAYVNGLKQPYEDIETIKVAVANARWVPHVPRIGEIEKNFVIPAWEKALLKQATIKAAFDAIEKDVNEILEETSKTPLPTLS
jgi:multiple sugar transport system substrate-binding protein